MESGIQLKESGIQVLLTENPVPGIRKPWRKIENSRLPLISLLEVTDQVVFQIRRSLQKKGRQTAVAKKLGGNFRTTRININPWIIIVIDHNRAIIIR